MSFPYYLTGTTETVWMAEPSRVTITVTPYEAEGSVTLEAMKSLIGRGLTADAFSFELRDEGNALLETVGNAADGSITFSALNFDEDDIGQTYTYTIREVVPASPETGMTYDPMVLSVAVTVTDAGNGVLTVTPDYPDDVTFNNTYEADGSVTLEADKTLSGRDLTDGAFTFQLRNSAGTVLQTKTNAADGSIVFDPIYYNESAIGQTYTYTIREVVPASPETGMTYDPMVMAITVTVSDAGNGVLTVIPNYPNDTTFNNSYEADGSVSLEADKVLSGRILKAGEFSFELREGSTLLETVSNAADGSIVFSALDFDETDIGQTYTYTIREVLPASPETGMTYDPMVISVDVAVTDAGNGVLTATPDYPADTTFGQHVQSIRQRNAPRPEGPFGRRP